MSIHRKLSISALSLLSLIGCGSEDDPKPSADACPHDYTKFTPSSATVSLRNDLLMAGGILRTSCTVSRTCHGGETDSQAGLFLGPGSTQASGPVSEEHANLVHANLVANARAATGLKRVVPLEPENSFLMHKLDDCLDEIKDQCTGASGTISSDNPPKCGDPMPRGTDLLAASERDLIRSWIKQGALNN